MIHIRKIRIENFQSHELTEIEFDSGLNIIVGPSDQGKSAILRALKWVLYNEPRGSEFIRQGTNYARVELELSNDYIISRERTGNKNRYTLTQKGEDSVVFEGFGNEVPLEIIKAHGIPKVLLDADYSTSLNVGEQLEGPFLLSQSGTLRAKAIGRLTGLHLIDYSVKETLADLRRENQLMERTTQEKRQIEDKLVEFEGLEQFKKQLEQAEVLGNKIENFCKDLEKLKLLHEQYNQIKTEMKRLKGILQRFSDIEKAIQLEKFISSKVEKLNYLYMLKKRWIQNEKEIETAKNILGKTQDITTANELVRKIDEALSLRTKWQKLNRERKLIQGEIKKNDDELLRLKNIELAKNIVQKIQLDIQKRNKILDYLLKLRNCEESIQEGIKYLAQNKKDTDNILKEYISVLQKIGKCPVCKSKIEVGQIHLIIDSYKGSE